MIKRAIKAVAAGMLRHYDYRLVDILEDPVGLSGACDALKRHGFCPATVIDVGVGNGTPWLYAAFPAARFELFEANSSFRPMIEKSTAGLNVGIHFCALGEYQATSSLEIDPTNPQSSTMARYCDRYLEVAKAGAPRPVTIETEVEVFPLDHFAPFRGPTLVKLDVEGYEGAVVKGATRTLQDTDVIISEVSVAQRTDSGQSLAEFLTLMESRGFSLINIAEIATMGRGGPIAYMDVVLVRSDSPMRYGARAATT